MSEGSGRSAESRDDASVPGSDRHGKRRGRSRRRRQTRDRPTRGPGDRSTTVLTVNVGLIALGTVGLVVWCSLFYEWKIGGAGAALVAGLALAERIVGKVPKFGERFQEGIGRVLSHPAALAVVALTLVAGLVAASFAGAVWVVSHEPAGEERRVELRATDGASRSTMLAPGETIRRPFWTGWRDSTSVEVTVARQRVRTQVVPWRWSTVRVRDRFDAPVVLLRPSVAWIDQAPLFRAVLEVRWDGEVLRQPWEGQLVLVGCPADEVCVLEQEREEAVFASLRSARPDSEAAWGTPLRVDEACPLAGGGRLSYAIAHGEDDPFAEREVEVLQQEDIQVEELNAS